MGGPLEGTPFRKRDLFGGAGEVAVWDLLDGKPMAPFAAALWCELAAGGSVGPHHQDGLEELVIFLAGIGTAAVGDEESPVGPGVLVRLPAGAPLAIRNASADAPLRYLIVKARAD